MVLREQFESTTGRLEQTLRRAEALFYKTETCRGAFRYQRWRNGVILYDSIMTTSGFLSPTTAFSCGEDSLIMVIIEHFAFLQ